MDADRELLLSLRLNAALARYARCLDSDHLEQWPDFFSEDCLYKVTTAENQAMGYPAALIYGSSRAMLRDRVRSLREANIYEGQAYRHILSGTIILDGGDGTDGTHGVQGVHGPARDTVRSETGFLVVRNMREGDSVLFASGRYLDVVALDAGVPAAVRERVVVLDSPRIDTLLALPL